MELGYPKANAIQDHNVNPGWWETGKHDLLKPVRVKIVNNPEWRLAGIDIACCTKPDSLQTIYITLVDHKITWPQRILARYGRLELFEKIWRSIPAYNSITKEFKSY